MALKQEPYWWEAAPRPSLPERPLPARIDVAIVGSGYTGLSAALTLAKAGRSVAVLDSGDAGHGGSSRNAGYVGRTLKHGFGRLLESHGAERARAIYRELQAAFDYVLALVERQGIACHLVRCGRYIAARSPADYDDMARELELRRKHLGDDFEMVPRAQQHREIGSDLYHGGAVIPDHACLHPGLYHSGLLGAALHSGAEIFTRTPVAGVERSGAALNVLTARGRMEAHHVLVATNGYTGPAIPYLHRRIVPFHGFMISTEPLPSEQVTRVLPNARTFLDYANNISFIRRAPDSPRILFGGRTGPAEPDLRRKAKRLQALLARIVPDLAGVRLSHVWTGRCGATMDLYPHIGARDGIHYAMGYCFAGVPMGTWLGHKAALRILASPEAATAFDDLRFPSQPLPWANPLLVRLFMAHCDWKDRRAWHSFAPRRLCKIDGESRIGGLNLIGERDPEDQELSAD